MFICQQCGSTSKPREPQTTKVVETREKIYTEKNQVVGRGMEIVREIRVCERCK